MSINSPGSSDVHSDAPMTNPRRRRRRMKKFRLDEISQVDVPAQGPARIAITKREDEDYDKRLLRPKDGESRSDFVSRFMADSKAREEFPEQSQRAAVANQQFKSVSKRMALTSQTEGHAHSIIGIQAGSEGLAEVKAGKTSFVDGHTHDWVMDDAGNIIIADADGHTHGVSVLVKNVGSEDEEITHLEKVSDSGKPAFLNDKDKDKDKKAETKAAEDSGSEAKVTKQENDAAKTVADQELELTQKRAERLEAVVALKADQREHFDGLDSEGQDTFLAKSDSERETVLKNVRAADPVVYTDSEGNEFRKSCDPTVLRLVKSNDDLRKQAAEDRQIAKRADFEKRATTELAHLPGELVEKADLLEAVSSLSGDSLEAVMRILKSKDRNMEAATKRLGTIGSPEGASAEEQIDAISKRLQTEDPTLTKEGAYNKALETPEGQEAFAQLRN